MEKLNININFNEDGWSPLFDGNTEVNCLNKIECYPFSPSLRIDKLGSVCDFSYTSYNRGKDKSLSTHGYTMNQSQASRYDDSQDFHLVDSRPVLKTKGRYPHKKFQKETTQAYQQKQQQEKLELMNKQNKKGGKKNLAQQVNHFNRNRFVARMRTLTEWSIEPLSTWNLVSEILLPSLPKQSLDITGIKVVDLKFCGKLNTFNKQLDRATPKSPIVLRDSSSLEISSLPTTSDDDILRDLLLSEKSDVDVVITDQIFACLISASQSKYSWHLSVMHIDGKLIFDKQDGSIVDLITVDETSSDPPLADNINKNNRPGFLGLEAVKVNNSFVQQIKLDDSSQSSKKYDEVPFKSSNILYRYRKFTIPPRTGSSNTKLSQRNINVAIRTEINAISPSTGDSYSDDYIFARTLCEYDAKAIKLWSTQLETQKGALLATEIRNNACQLTKWASQALLSDCNTLKLGFTVRKFHTDRDNHIIYSVQSYKTKELSGQMGLKEENAWGIFRALVDLFLDNPEGQYVIIRAPIKPILKVYRLPDDEDLLSK